MNNKYNAGDVVELKDYIGEEFTVIAAPGVWRQYTEYAVWNKAEGLSRQTEATIKKLIKAAPPSYELGEEVEVKDTGGWTKRIYISAYEDMYYCIICGKEGNLGSKSKSLPLAMWPNIRKIKREDTIELTVKINGKTSKLSELSDETIASIKKLEKNG